MATAAQCSSAVPDVMSAPGWSEAKSVVSSTEEVPNHELVPHMVPDHRTSGTRRLLEAGQLQSALRVPERGVVILHGSLWLPIVRSHPLALVVPD